MAGAAVTDDSAASTAGMRDEERSLSGESLSEWRSCERADSDSPSTSPPFWDTDSDDDDPGPKPLDLFGRYTWRIENFSKEKKREMKSEPFEAGGYKWYILVYPQGCDVSNHLSLFLCVANHDKLLPGWSHFAQFTIAVGNIDPKKMKYSDTLHRFWKKEHDWGWKKFMELSKIQDGFLVEDALEIIAQVQVIREKVDRPFRCLDRPYRRELLRVYMTNVEQIYRRFVDEQRSKLSKLIEDKMRWSSFRAFWSAIDPSTRHRMSREKTDTILKVLVKHFFVEKEVTSTLVMDSLYTSLKALEYQMKGKKGRTKLADLEELPAPMVHVDVDMFVLADDVIALLERPALEPLPCQPLTPKDDKSSQSRMKDGSSGEVYKVSMEREERRLTELGQKILETFVLSHIFSGIEGAYQEAVALKRQEELIREEEEAGLLENHMKGKRGGGANEKDKRAKKKQAKQKKNNRKAKDKERDEKYEVKILERIRDEIAIDNSDGLPAMKVEVTTKLDALEDGASDGSDMPSRGKIQRNKGLSIISIGEEGDGLPSTSSVAGGSGRNSSGCCTAPKLDQDTVLLTLRDKLRKLGQRLHEKNIEGQKLLKAHFEARDAKAKAVESSNSSGSLEKPSDVPESPKHSSEVKVDLKVNGTPNKDVPVVNCVREEAVSGIPATTNTEPVPAPVTRKADPVSNKDNGSSSKMKATIASPCCSKPPPIDMDKDAPLPSKSPRINRAAPVPQKSSLVDKATPVSPKSPPVDKAAPIPPKSPAVNKATPVHPKSPAVDKATPVRPRSPAVDKVTPVRPKSPAVDRATPIPPKSPPVEKASPAPPISTTGGKDASLPSRSLQIDKSVPAPPRLPQVDNAAMPSSELSQTSLTTDSEAQEETTSVKVTATSVSEVAVTASRPSSAPVFPTPRSTAPATSRIHVSTLLSRSMSEAAGRSVNNPSPSAPPYVPQTYRNATVGKPGLGTTSASLAYQSTSLGHDTAPSQPLSAYASSTAIMMPPAGRSDQLSARHGFKSGLGKLEAHDSWQMWKGGSNADKHLWRDHAPYQQMTNSQAYEQPRRDDTYQQASSRGTEKLSRYGGLQSRQFQSETAVGHAWHQPQGPVGEEFPHLDIINDLLEEDHCNGNKPELFRQDYQACGLPFSPRGNLADLEMASVSSPGRFNSTERYYDDGFSRAYDMSAFLGLRERQFPSTGTYSNGLSDMSASKPWLNGSPNSLMSLGVNRNGYPHQVGDYTNLGSGVNGASVWRRHANGRWCQSPSTGFMQRFSQKKVSGYA
ncbi:TNF receptor-associated factor homolog 1a-like [Phragmites australis]|uniref:TNF receptor-associated factor homolog 1a-like n=1 Tax=Phragmites australis TaxID=29695 RepID=UPI002D7745F7|nr:TNF receptor-associated factor homolog 1a-like [Phragmites australis]